MQTKIAFANIVTAFDLKTVGTKVTNPEAFLDMAVRAIEAFDFEAQRKPGQGFLVSPAMVPFVSAMTHEAWACQRFRYAFWKTSIKPRYFR